MGKMELLSTYGYGAHPHNWKVRKHLTMSMEANRMIFLKVQ